MIRHGGKLQIYPHPICPDWIPLNLTLWTWPQVAQWTNVTNPLFSRIRRQRAGQRTFTETERGMALEEKPGVKSSSSIVPCFLFVEVRNRHKLSFTSFPLVKKLELTRWDQAFVCSGNVCACVHSPFTPRSIDRAVDAGFSHLGSALLGCLCKH